MKQLELPLTMPDPVQLELPLEKPEDLQKQMRQYAKAHAEWRATEPRREE